MSGVFSPYPNTHEGKPTKKTRIMKDGKAVTKSIAVLEPGVTKPLTSYKKYKLVIRDAPIKRNWTIDYLINFVKEKLPTLKEIGLEAMVPDRGEGGSSYTSFKVMERGKNAGDMLNEYTQYAKWLHFRKVSDL